MDAIERAVLLREAAVFFCKAMATDSYASSAEAHPIPEMPGWKGYEYREGDFRLLDAYFVHPDTKKSVGFTKIWYKRVLIWWMSYGGYYVKEAIPCLKAALLENYRNGIFNAGRARNGFRLGEYAYHIDTVGRSSFERFIAHEAIHPIKAVGFYPTEGGHDIWGMALI
ncbi:MAG: hypothetical protein V4474_03135 [Patescibacteria group bacterium]